MTYDEERSKLSEQLDNVVMRLIVASDDHDRRKVKQCRIEAKRILMEYERLIADIVGEG